VNFSISRFIANERRDKRGFGLYAYNIGIHEKDRRSKRRSALRAVARTETKRSELIGKAVVLTERQARSGTFDLVNCTGFRFP